MLRVYLVEDSQIIVDRLVEFIFKEVGATLVGHAPDAPSAIEAIRQIRPDFIIVDLSLQSEGGGFDVLRSLEEITPRPITAIFTNYPAPRHRARAAELGADYFFDKI